MENLTPLVPINQVLSIWQEHLKYSNISRLPFIMNLLLFFLAFSSLLCFNLFIGVENREKLKNFY